MWSRPSILAVWVIVESYVLVTPWVLVVSKLVAVAELEYPVDMALVLPETMTAVQLVSVQQPCSPSE